MSGKLVVTIVAMVAMIGLVITGCTTPTPQPPEPEPQEPCTTGPFLDEVVITKEADAATAIQKLKDDALDVYAYGLADASLHAQVLADANLASVSALGAYHELTFNPVGPTFPATGKLNPFSDRQFREAMHWLIDRDYIVGTIMGGLAVPRYTCLDPQGADASERFPDIMAGLIAKYGHNPGKAAAVIAERMAALDASLVDGKWHYNGEPVELIGLIRTEDQRKDIGGYFAGLLEGEGFNVTRQYGISRELLPIWFESDPALGLFHFYTGGWVSTRVYRDDGDKLGFFYTNLWTGYGSPLWQAYVNDPDFYEAAEKLWSSDFESMEERSDIFEICLPRSMEDNVRMFLLSRKSFSPMQADVRLVADTYGGIQGSWLWALTAHFADGDGEPMAGGTLRVAMPDVLTNPWNPIAGSNLAYDMFPVLATGDQGLQPDPRDGLRWPGRIQKAEVLVETGYAVGVTNTDWCSLTFVPDIRVPLDAWADWDASTQEFITVQERFGAGNRTALTKSVSYYPKEIFEIPLHDGSTLSMGDFILYTILQFDRGKQASTIYDESYAGQLDSFMDTFKGVRFITDDPDYGLIVEYYSDNWQLDAELMVTTMFPFYAQGPGFWHTIGLGIRAEEGQALAFSQSKSNTLGVEWMSFVSGPSLPFLTSYLTSAKAANYVPYLPTMSLYVTEAEATERWANLQNWYAEKGHFWVASGPFYLEGVDSTAKTIHLRRFEDYPDPMDRWLFLLEPLP